MGRVSKIIQLDLEKTLLEGRAAGRTVPEIVVLCNDKLWERDGEGCETVSKSAVDRYIAAADRSSVPAIHRPQEAEANAALHLNFGVQFMDLNVKLRKWLVQADEHEVPILDKDGEVVGHKIDWYARTSVAGELRKNLGLYADLMERIYSADQIAQFQRTVVECIGEADPATAGKIRARLRERQDLKRAAILGQA